MLLQGSGALHHSCQMVYLNTNYWKNGVILKFRVFTENFQLILEMRREKMLDRVNFHKFNKIYWIVFWWESHGMGWDRHKLLWDGMGQKNMSHGQACEFSKNFRVACPRTLWGFFCSSTCFKLILPEKTTLEKMLKFGAFFFKKLLITPQTWKIVKELRPIKDLFRV